jgi:uncharacterized phage protein (TIGR02218 family)
MRDELYLFTRGASTWTYTSSDTSVDYDSNTYEPATIGHGIVETKTELSKQNLEVKLGITNAMAVDIMTYNGDDPLMMTLFIKTTSGVMTGWKGRYASHRLSGGKIFLTVESVFTALRRPGLRARYQKNCRHALYGTECGVDQETHAVASTVSYDGGIVVTSPEAELETDGRYTGGMVKLSDGSLRWIIRHVGPILGLSRPFDTISAGDDIEVTIYPGCKHNTTDCLFPFENLENYGGFPWIPDINPMGGGLPVI